MAFTTDPARHDLAWCVRWHPDHGRSVILYRDADIASVHMVFQDGPVLFRSGGYWWDGSAWFRPGQLWDVAREEFFKRPVPAAATVTAADLLADGSADLRAGYVLGIGDVKPDKPFARRWLDEFALWAERRGDTDLSASVVTLTAPELAADRLVGVAEMAEITGIAASTLRAYIAREEADVPLAQAVIGGRARWARPVAEEWAEFRRRSAEGVTAAVSAPAGGGRMVPPGEAELAAALGRSFFASLWEYRPFRSRWALRWRNDQAVRDVADSLGADAAGYMLRRLILIDDLAAAVEHAFLGELAAGQQLAGLTDDDDPVFYGIVPGVARMLDWLIRHCPDRAAHSIGSIMGEAERRFSIPREVTERSVRMAMNSYSKLDDEALREFLHRVMSPGDDSR